MKTDSLIVIWIRDVDWRSGYNVPTQKDTVDFSEEKTFIWSRIDDVHFL